MLLNSSVGLHTTDDASSKKEPLTRSSSRNVHMIYFSCLQMTNVLCLRIGNLSLVFAVDLLAQVNNMFLDALGVMQANEFRVRALTYKHVSMCSLSRYCVHR